MLLTREEETEVCVSKIFFLFFFNLIIPQNFLFVKFFFATFSGFFGEYKNFLLLVIFFVAMVVRGNSLAAVAGGASRGC